MLFTKVELSDVRVSEEQFITPFGGLPGLSIATTRAPAAVSYRITVYLAMLVNKFFKTITLRMASSIATGACYHRGTHLPQMVLKRCGVKYDMTHQL